MCREIRPFVFAALLLVTGLAHGASTKTWTGLGGDANWTTGGNWGGSAPSAGDLLVFPTGAAQLTNNNDFAPSTNFTSISITENSTGYTITGNSIVLTGGATALGSANGTNSVQIAITFSTAAPTIVSAAGGGLTITGNIANGGFDITFDSTAPLTVSGIISGSGGIIEQGSGGAPALTLSGNNTYTGLTTINNNGTLIAAHNNALGGTASGTTVNSGGTLELDTGVTITGEALSLDGTGAGSGALKNLTGFNSYNGNITIVSNATFIGGSVASTLSLGSGSLSLGGNSVSFVGGGIVDVSQVISGTGGVTVAGGLNVTLSGSNSYSGVTNVVSGQLTAPTSVAPSTNGPLGNSAGAVQIGNNGTLLAGGAFSRNILAGGSTPGLMIGNGVNVSGTITISTSFVSFEIINDMTASSCTVSGPINTGSGTSNSVGFATGPAQSVTVTGVISGSAAINADGPGTVNLNAANTYTGPTTINAGTLKTGVTNAIPSGNDVSITTNTLDLSGGSVSLNSVTGAGMINLGSNTLTISNATSATISAVISDTSAGNLTMSGAGILTLTATNTYSGSTTVMTGTLDVASPGSINSSTVSVLGGHLTGSGTTGPVNSTGGFITAGDSPSSFAIFGTGALTLDAGSNTDLKIGGSTPGTNQDQLIVTGVFTPAGMLNLDLTGASAGTNSIVSYTSHSASPAFAGVTLVPNPSNLGATLTFGASTLDVVLASTISAPTLSAPSDSGTLGDNVTNVTTPVIGGTGAGSGAIISVYDAATLKGTATANGSGVWSFTCPTLSSGSHSLVATQSQFGGLSAPLMLVIDTTAPTANIAQLASQTDPTSGSTIKFQVTFSKPISGFTNSDVQITGTAGATTAVVSTLTANTVFEVDVTGMTKGGTVIIDVPAGAATDVAGNLSAKATATDNTVTFNSPVTAPSIISQLTACGDQFQPFSYTISATGTAPITYTATGLPAGLSLTGAVISGSPTVYGTFSVTLTASNAATPADSKTLSLTIVPQGISITSPTSAQGKVGASFTYSFSGTSGAPPVSFVIGSPLPGGLSASGATISGTPSVAGDFTVPVTATDAAGQTFTGSLTISILAKAGNAAPIVDLIVTDIPTGDTGDVGTPVDFTVNATDPEGGKLTYAWTITAGATPMVLANATASEYLQTFDVAGTYTVRVTVTDASGASAFQETTISVTTPAPTAPTLGTISINDPDANGGGPVTTTSSSKYPNVGETCILTAKGATVVTGPLSYTWDFGDGSAISSPSTNTNISHVYATAGDYTVTLDAVDANSVHAAHKLTALVSVVDVPVSAYVPLIGQSLSVDVSVMVPSADSTINGQGLVMVSIPLGTSITDAGPGRYSLRISILTAISGQQTRYRALTVAERDANEFTTDFGISGRGLVKGTEPTVHYQEPKLFVATTHMRDRATKVEVSKSRITLPVSRSDVGLPPVVTAEPKSRVIGVTALSGAFNFSRNSAGQSLAQTTTAADLGGRGDVSDKMTVTGTFELPAGLDMSKPQEMQFALGNVVETIVLGTNGSGKSTRATFKVQTKSKTKSTMTSAGQMAKYSITLNAPGLSAAGFESEGVTNKPMGNALVVHGAMLLGGVTYGVEIPTSYGVKAKSTGSTGALKILKPKKK